MVEDESKIVSFRFTAEEFKNTERIASLASRHGKIRNDTVTTLAKVCLM